MDVQLSDSTPGFSAAAASIGLTLPQLLPSSQATLAPAPPSAPQAIAPPDSTDPVALSDFPTSGKSLAGALKIDSHLGEAASAFLHAPRPLSVEFHTDRLPNEIVTILRDPTTGQVYAEFPPDAVARLADFFNHLAGFVVDQKA